MGGGERMSNFACPVCGAASIDSPTGYVTGCEHYPIRKLIDDRRAFREALAADLEKLKRIPANGSPGRAGRRTP
jgi:hypothetical protein